MLISCANHTPSGGVPVSACGDSSDPAVGSASSAAMRAAERPATVESAARRRDSAFRGSNGSTIETSPADLHRRSTPQPVHYRPMFGAFGGALATSVTFVSQAALATGTLDRLNLAKPLVAVRDVRRINKSDMVHNYWQPNIEVDPETYEVRADGELLTCEPAA